MDRQKVTDLKCIIICCALVFLTACAGPGYFEPIKAVGPNGAVLYLYRPKADNPGMQPLRLSYPDIIIAGESVGVLKFNEYKTVPITSGQYRLRVTGLTEKADWAPKDIDLEFDIKAGETKYIKLDVRFNTEEMSIGQPETRYLIFATPMDAKSAIYEIRDTDPE